MKNNEVPIDVFTLTQEHVRKGIPLEGDNCPVAYMLMDEWDRIEYQDINVCRLEIEYEQGGVEIIKPNSWTLLGLIHAIDHPNTTILAINKLTGKKETLFSRINAFNLPLRIEEYESWFNLYLPGHEQAHRDNYEPKSIYSLDKNGNPDELIRFEIHYTPYQETTQ